MKIKPKDLVVNLPIVLMFNQEDEIAQFAANINTIVHGEVKLKTDVLGMLGGQHVAIFYLKRNDEFSELRENFGKLIEDEEIANYNKI